MLVYSDNKITPPYANLVTLFEEQYSTTSEIVPIDLKPSGYAEHIDYSDRIIPILKDLRYTELYLRSTCCGSFCI
ncbi:hypothetical protein AYI68_g2548 [Smittium mucronatum]|uniref:Uncharacterized protein n=1 Tax=Smittium mucronatum TaxID=133383 RepID=A0A1R0H2E1_9FUNG|nr:hypothetical protein AYI68_g2548 [Smittium mucronatum]